ncbi:NAD(P)-dependent dehydrogenase, short-chain alcohol dehydrogenase family [Shimia gijangensis]|uniref:NAD(P)-dependent dehydrogenase, short-chain alcohol dehydrogenase family n=1 Tax=Shimia gijangensis TaxID=1470563 RepID=A0A1M6LLR2_9RHOB|nr:SDR family oxidoreductase [Shimia gijangensis]SHJ72012.1 NAD(P)-dependent dehydrogenase, short-chain alcohol dehydrogenase family [Shimia gijangensis]
MTGRVLVTAGASGIGRAMGEAFDKAGYEVWVSDLNGRALGEVPVHWRTSHVDVIDEPQMAAMFAEIKREWGGLDVLCANAGVAGPTAQIEDIALDDWRSCVSVNLDGTFLAAKYTVPMMKKAKAGSIIVTSSTAGQHGYPNRGPYCSAKWAVIGLAKTLAMELGAFGGRCNVICPGSVEGDRMEGVLSREAEAKGMTRDEVYIGYASGTSMGSFVEARDIGDMAVFLGSDASRFVSGQVIAVDGHTVNPDPKV